MEAVRPVEATPSATNTVKLFLLLLSSIQIWLDFDGRFEAPNVLVPRYDTYLLIC